MKYPDQRQGRLNFTDGNGVNPDAAVDFRKSQTEPLSELVEIRTVAEPTDQPIARVRNEQQVSQ